MRFLCFAFFFSAAKLLCHSTSWQPCTDVFIWTITLLIWRYRDTGMLLPVFLHTHILQTKHIQRKTYSRHPAPKWTNTTRRNQRAPLLRCRWEQWLPSPPCPCRSLLFPRTPRSQGRRDSSWWGCQEPAMAACLSSQTELNWCQSHWLLLQWAASLGFAF